jgi:hypothetical protein
LRLEVAVAEVDAVTLRVSMLVLLMALAVQGPGCDPNDEPADTVEDAGAAEVDSCGCPE